MVALSVMIQFDYKTYENLQQGYNSVAMSTSKRGMSLVGPTYEVMWHCGNPLTLQPEESGRKGSAPSGAPPECHKKGSQAQLGLFYFCDPNAWC